MYVVVSKSMLWCQNRVTHGAFSLNDTCEFESDLSWNNGELELVGPLGNSQMAVIKRKDSSKYHRFFTLTENAQLKLCYISLEGGDLSNTNANQPGIDEVGGAVLLIGPGTSFYAYDSLLEFHKATNGGAIYCQNGKVMLDNTTLKNCKSAFNMLAGGSGGGIYLDEGSLVVTGKSKVRENNADEKGGGIFATSKSVVKITKAYVESNYAVFGGGGIYCGYSECNIVQSIIQLNSVSQTQAIDDSHGVSCQFASCSVDTLSASRSADCDAGYYGGIVLTKDFEQPTTQIQCSPCGSGFFAPSSWRPTSTKENSCVPCPPGKWGNTSVTVGLNEQEACPFVCEAGKTGIIAGAQSKLEANCTACFLGGYCPTRIALPCPLGRYGSIRGAITLDEGCSLYCPHGTFGIKEGQSSLDTACGTCPAGTYSTAGSIVCVGCPMGRFGNLPNGEGLEMGCFGQCPKGRYGSVIGATTVEDACSNTCPPGTFGDKIASITMAQACSNCPAGSYRTAAYNLEKCEKCSSGRYGQKIGATSLSDGCTGICPNGKFGTSVGQVSQVTACTETCPPGKYGIKASASRVSDACITCAIYEFCLGGVTCTEGRSGLACASCQQEPKKFYAAANNQCFQCPTSPHMQWFQCLVLLCVFIYFIKLITDEEHDVFDVSVEGDDDGDEEVRRSQDKDSFISAISSNSGSPARLFTTLLKHFVTLGFALSQVKLISLPQELRVIIRDVVSALSFDISGLISSPECQWKASGWKRYAIKLLWVPLMAALFLCWFCILPNFKKHKKLRNSRNHIFAVVSYIWITTLYSLSIFQIMTAWDCSRDETSKSNVLDSNPSIECSIENDEWGIMLLLSILFSIFFCVVPFTWMLHNIFPPSRSHKGFIIGWGFPHWTDKHFCSDYIKGLGPCYNCYACDQRQRFAFIFEKYHSKYFYWEFVALLRKILIAIPNLFLTTKIYLSLSIQVTINVIYIVLMCRLQPFLTDKEYAYTHRFGRLEFLKQDRRKQCSRKACGANTFLDVILLVGEVSVCVSALVRELTYSAYRNSASVYTNTSTSGHLISEHSKVIRLYPSMDMATTTFDWIGITMFLVGFAFFFKETFFWLMKVCRRKCKSKKEKEARAKAIEQKRKAILESRQRQKVYPMEPATHSETERSQKVLENTPRSKSDSLLRLQSVRVEHGASSSEYLNALKQEKKLFTNHIDSEAERKDVKPNIVQSVTEETKIAPKPRKKLVDKGLQFWTTKGTKMSTEEKIKYLKSKGLTENEIFTVKTNGENELYKLKIQGMMDNPETYYK